MRASTWPRALMLKLRSLLRRRRVESDLEDEFAYHIEQHTALLAARGMTPDAARAAAIRSIGGLERRKDECRDARGVSMIEHVVADLRYSVRRLTKARAFTAVALITLSLGLGANTAMFTVVRGVLLRPLAYRDPTELVVPLGTVSPGDYLAWRTSATTLAGVGAAEWWAPALTGGTRPEPITALHVTRDIYTVLGAAPLLGRVPSEAEEHSGSTPVVVLSYASWMKRFRGDSSAIGKTLTFNGVAHTIVGVMPKRFQFAPYWATSAELWAPLVLDTRAGDRSGSSLRVFARLAPGTTAAQARENLAAIVAPVDSAHAQWARQLAVVPLHQLVVEDVSQALVILQVAVALLLLIACANVAHLQLMRAASLERESAMRVALGASTMRVVQQSMIESLVLCGTGAAIGLGFGYAAVRALVAYAPPGLPRVDAISFDPMVFAMLAGTAVVATIVCGLIPALRTAGVRMTDAMQAARGSNDSPRRRRVRALLVVSEFAMTLVLVAGAGLVVRSFMALSHVNTGFDQRRTLSMQIALAGAAHDRNDLRAGFFEDLQQRVRALPGVEATAIVNHVPIGGDHWTFPTFIEGRELPQPGAESKALFRVAGSGYFGTIGVALVQGRDISPDDSRQRAQVVVINEAMARHHWPDGNVIGKRISVSHPRTGAQWFSVVGVVKNMTQGALTDGTRDEMFFPFVHASAERGSGLFAFLTPSSMTLVLRTANDPAQVSLAAAGVVSELDRDAAVSNVATLESLVGSQFVQPRFYMLLLGAFAVVALALALVGVYGVISYSVTQRTRELGVRAALGANHRDAFRLVLRDATCMAALGSAIGIVVALWATRFARAMLFEVQPNDLTTFVVATALLWCAALAAAYFPARRAANVDPLTALRAD